MRKGIGSHQSASMKNDEWLTPPDILKKLGGFDLDPCAPIVRPWPTAVTHLTKQDDGLSKEWRGRGFCNPPYGLEAAKWLEKCAIHGDAVALVFARTETKMFFDHVWTKAHSILFIEGRLYFHYVDGTRASANSGAPSCLFAYDSYNSTALENSKISGKFIRLK